jgi:hypothetical protein
MKNFFLLLAVFVLMLLSGCVSAPRADKDRDSQAKTFSQNENSSGIYIYRDVFLAGGIAKYKITLDNQLLGQVDNHTFMYLEIPPGKHNIEAKEVVGGIFAASVKVETVAGKNYFWELDADGGLNFRSVDEISGRTAVSKLSMVDVPQSAVQAIADEMKKRKPEVNAVSIKPEIPVKITKPAKAPTERLVLMPLRVDEEDKRLLGAMETALVQGLQQNYIVFAGEQVAQKAREIFLKESRNIAKKECDETRCMQGIAEAFQAELIATANVTKQDGGYFLALSIQNIFDNKVVYSNSVPCEGCTTFQVVNKLKELSAQ